MQTNQCFLLITKWHGWKLITSGRIVLMGNLLTNELRAPGTSKTRNQLISLRKYQQLDAQTFVREPRKHQRDSGSIQKCVLEQCHQIAGNIRQNAINHKNKNIGLSYTMV